jgi:hypothetical protein
MVAAGERRRRRRERAAAEKEHANDPPPVNEWTQDAHNAQLQREEFARRPKARRVQSWSSYLHGLDYLQERDERRLQREEVLRQWEEAEVAQALLPEDIQRRAATLEYLRTAFTHREIGPLFCIFWLVARHPLACARASAEARPLLLAILAVAIACCSAWAWWAADGTSPQALPDPAAAFLIAVVQACALLQSWRISRAALREPSQLRASLRLWAGYNSLAHQLLMLAHVAIEVYVARAYGTAEWRWPGRLYFAESKLLSQWAAAYVPMLPLFAGIWYFCAPRFADGLGLAAAVLLPCGWLGQPAGLVCARCCCSLACFSHVSHYAALARLVFCGGAEQLRAADRLQRSSEQFVVDEQKAAALEEADAECVVCFAGFRKKDACRRLGCGRSRDSNHMRKVRHRPRAVHCRAEQRTTCNVCRSQATSSTPSASTRGSCRPPASRAPNAPCARGRSRGAPTPTTTTRRCSSRTRSPRACLGAPRSRTRRRPGCTRCSGTSRARSSSARESSPPTSSGRCTASSWRGNSRASRTWPTFSRISDTKFAVTPIQPRRHVHELYL